MRRKVLVLQPLEKMKKISSNLTPFLKYGYLILLSVGIFITLQLPVDKWLLGAVLTFLISVVSFLFHHNLCPVWAGEKELEIKKGNKKIVISYSDIDRIEIDRFVSQQPVRVSLKDGNFFRFVTYDSLFYANPEILYHLRNDIYSNKEVVWKTVSFHS